MIGCDECDDWYHWWVTRRSHAPVSSQHSVSLTTCSCCRTCVGITQEPPEDESWFCPKHRATLLPPKPSTSGSGKKKGKAKGKTAKKKKSLGWPDDKRPTSDVGRGCEQMCNDCIFFKFLCLFFYSVHVHAHVLCFFDYIKICTGISWYTQI